MLRISKNYNFIAFYLSSGLILEMLTALVILIYQEELPWLVPFRKAFLAIIIAYALILIVREGKLLEFSVISIIFTIVLYISYTIIPEISSFFSRILLYSYGYVIVTACLISTINQPDKLIRALIPYIYVSLVYCVIQLLVYASSGAYSMQFSYNTLVPAILAFILGREKVYYWIFAIIIVLVDLLCGSRGCFVCFTIAIFLYIYMQRDMKKGGLLLGFVLIFVIILVENYDIIAKVLLHIIPGSRLLRYLSVRDIHLSGRDIYYENLLREIVNSNHKFHGLFSDRFYMARVFGRRNMDEIFGSYSHNLLIEVIYQFGWLGYPLLLLFFYKLFHVARFIKKRCTVGHQILFILFTSYCLGQLLFSSSYLVAISFGELSGLILYVGKIDSSKSMFRRKKVKFIYNRL